MFNHASHRIIGRVVIAGLLGGAIFGSIPARASETTAQLEDVPTQLVTPTDPVAYPDPACLGCKIVTKRTPPASEEDDTIAVLEVTYFDDANPIFVGDIVLTVLLQDSDEYRSVVIDDVVLTDGQAVEFDVLAELDWSWAEAERVMVRMEPSS